MWDNSIKVQINHSIFTPTSPIMPCKLITSQVVLCSFTLRMGFHVTSSGSALNTFLISYLWWCFSGCIDELRLKTVGLFLCVWCECLEARISRHQYSCRDSFSFSERLQTLNTLFESFNREILLHFWVVAIFYSYFNNLLTCFCQCRFCLNLLACQQTKMVLKIIKKGGFIFSNLS